MGVGRVGMVGSCRLEESNDRMVLILFSSIVVDKSGIKVVEKDCYQNCYYCG